MTHDETGWKCWKNGEYNKLDPKTLEYKLQQHTLHCPYKGTSNEINTIFRPKLPPVPPILLVHKIHN